MTSANERQVGGEHYRREGLVRIQHWDIIDDNSVGYLEGVITKYISRWRMKGGIQDLEKAEHYLQKLIENVETKGRRPRGVVDARQVADFCNDYELHVVEAAIVNLLLRWSCLEHLQAAQKDLRDMIQIERGVGNDS